MNDVLQVQGINSKGFGMIPKLVMQDKRLTAEAKAIYSYFCSYAGAGRTAFPGRDKIVADLGISKSRFYTHLNKLKEYGYIKVQQEKDKGKFKRNIYTMAENLPCPDIKDTVKKQSPCPSFPCTENPCTESRDTNNNSIKINKYKNTSQSSQSEKPDRQDEDRTDDTARKIALITQSVKDNIGYDDLSISKPHDIRLVDEFIAIIIDTVMTEGKYVRIGGEDKPRELVKGVLMKLTYEDIELVIDQFKSVTTRINKKKQYILTMLYNSKLELDSHYTNAVESDKWQ